MTATPPGGPVGVRSAARDVLRGRLLIGLSNRDAERGVLQRLPLSLAPTGVVLTGAPRLGVVDRLRRENHGLVIACEPDADSTHYATTREPFLLPPDDLLGPVTLDRVLDDQMEAGASFALTPTGYLRPGDPDAMKAVIDIANELDRDDVVVRLPFDPASLRTNADQLAAIACSSRHPVALSLADEQDPMARRGVLDGLRAINAAVGDLALWRTDLAGVPHLVDGGLCAMVGFIPSLRHGLSPGTTGRRINAADRTPHVLLPEHLRYMRGSEVQDRYASSEPPHCASAPCHGAPLDRFSGSDADRLVAHEHNAVTLLEIAAEFHRLGTDDRARWWQSRLQRAITAHEEAERQTGRHWPLPTVLAAWAKSRGVAA